MRVFNDIEAVDIFIDGAGSLHIEQGEDFIYIPSELVQIFVNALNEQTRPPKTRREL